MVEKLFCKEQMDFTVTAGLETLWSECKNKANTRTVDTQVAYHNEALLHGNEFIHL